MRAPEPGYDVVVPEDENGSAEAALRREYGSMKLKELRRRVKADGMPADELELAMDSDDPEDVLIEYLLMQHVDTQREAQEASAALRRELDGLKLKELRKRAREAGVDAEKLEDAMDADDLHGAVVALLLECTPRPGA